MCITYLFISELNFLIISLIVMYIYLSQIVKITYWGLFIILNTALMISLGQSTTIFTFYIIFELVNIVTYILLGLNNLRLNNLKANIIYFLVGFTGSIILLYGIYAIFNPILSNYIGFSFVFIALILKIGAFPFSFWVIPVYTALPNSTFIFFISVLKLNYLNILTILFSCYFTHKIPKFMFFISIMGTLIIGACLIAKQTTFKGFLAASSILNLPLWLISFYAIQPEFNLEVNFFNRNLLYVFFYTTIYIIGGLSIILLVLGLQTKKRLTFLNKQFIQSFFYPLGYFKDNYLTLALWILGGFPPFVLFLSKFYILYYTMWSSNIFLIFSVLFILNSLGLYGYAKILTTLLIKLKYT